MEETPIIPPYAYWDNMARDRYGFNMVEFHIEENAHHSPIYDNTEDRPDPPPSSKPNLAPENSKDEQSGKNVTNSPVPIDDDDEDSDTTNVNAEDDTSLEGFPPPWSPLYDPTTGVTTWVLSGDNDPSASDTEELDREENASPVEFTYQIWPVNDSTIDTTTWMMSCEDGLLQRH